MPLRLLRFGVSIVLLSLGYFAAGKLGLLLAETQENTTLVWPPTGIALAAVLLKGNRVWPGIALGAFLVNATTSAPLPAVLAITTGNVLEALVGAILLRWAVVFTNSLERIRDVLGLAGLAALASTAISATVGVSALYLASRVPAGGFGIVWLYWWLGDVMGALVVAPLLLVWGDRRAISWVPRRAGEAIGLSAALVLVCQLTYGGWLDHETVRPPLTYLGAPLLVWAALRFGPRGAVTASFATIAFAIGGTIQGNGPFVLGTVEESLAYLHTYLAVTSVTVLLLAAIQSEWNRAQSELRQAEARSRALIEHSFDAIALIDRAGTILYSSPSATRITGRTTSELIGQNGFERIHPDDQPRARQLLGEITSTPGNTLRSQFRYRHKDGSWIWLEVTGVNLLNELAVRAIVVNYRDITEQTKSERALRDSESRYRSLFERNVAGVFRSTLDGRVLDCNESFARMFGFASKNDVLARHAAELYAAPGDRNQYVKTLLQARSLSAYEIKLCRADGAPLWALENVAISPGEGDGPTVIEGTIIDITDRKLAEAALRDSEASLDAAQERAKMGSWEIDASAERGRWSKGLFRLLNRDPALGEPTRIESLEFVHPDDRQIVTDTFARMLDQVGPHSVDFRTNPEHGPVRYLNSTVESVRDEQGTVLKYVGNAVDITERKRAEAELQASQLRLAALSRQLITAQETERRHLARELHDEIGQILSAVHINLQGVKNGCELAVGQRLDDSIGVVSEAIRQVRGMSLDLRPPMLDDFGLVPALRWFVERQKHPGDCDLDLVTRCPGTRLPVELESAAFRLVQEALTNVVRHARARHTTVEVAQDDHELCVAVRDDGVGFDVAAARDRATHGSSVGLLGMQERVELLGGRFELESAPGKGTTIHARFWLTSLPSGEAD